MHQSQLKGATGLALSPTLIFLPQLRGAGPALCVENCSAHHRKTLAAGKPNYNALWRPFRSSAYGGQECWICYRAGK